MELLEASLLRGGDHPLLLPLSSLWTCLAFLAAFLALWRARSAAPAKAAWAASPPADTQAATATATATSTAAPRETAAVVGACRKEVLFAVYGDVGGGCCYDEDRDPDRDDDDEEEEDRDRVGRARKKGRRDLDWCCVGDLKALEGCVVRLWEDERGAAGSLAFGEDEWSGGYYCNFSVC